MAAESTGCSATPEEASSGRGRTCDLREGVVVGTEADPGIWPPHAGRVIFQCCIATRAHPWKAFTVGRKGRALSQSKGLQYHRWKSWSAEVRMVVSHFVHLEIGRDPYLGPVDLDMLFVLDPRGQVPDRTNLGKSLEDILQGLIYANDRQVVGGDIRRIFIGNQVVPGGTVRWEGPERIHWRVTSLG
jgi:Holliday junction resolvase RusA-like endonuclease